MKRISILLICAFAFGGCCRMKKLQRHDSLEINPTTLELEAKNAENPTVDIDFDLTVPKKHVPKRSQMIFQPQFLTVSNSYNLQPVVINGKSMARKEARMVKKGETLPYSGSVRVESGKKPVTVKYDVTTPMLAWMPESELIGWTLVNCGKKYKEEIIDRHLIAASIKIPESEVATAPNVITEEKITEKASVETTYFIINSSTLDVNLASNAKNIQAIKSLMNQIKSDSKLELVSISVTGSASPDGTEKINSKLSHDRAATVVDMIVKELGVDKSMIKVSSMGANWQGFIDLIKDSSLTNKTEIITIATSKDSDWNKTLKLRMLHNYDTIKKEYLPQLRAVKCDVSYRHIDSISRQIVVK